MLAIRPSRIQLDWTPRQRKGNGRPAVVAAGMPGGGVQVLPVTSDWNTLMIELGEETFPVPVPARIPAQPPLMVLFVMEFPLPLLPPAGPSVQLVSTLTPAS